MEISTLLEGLKKFNIHTREDYFGEAFSRNIGLLSDVEQKQLSGYKIAIPGMGGVGGIHLITLVRSGIGKFNIADFDTYEPANINRQYGAKVPDFGRPKIQVMKEQALYINPYLELSLFEKGIHEKNIDRFLDGVDLVVDGLDFFKFDVRRMLFKKAAEKGIYVITAAPLGFSAALLVFSPNGMGFDEYFNIIENMKDNDKFLSFAMGLAPKPTHIKYMDLSKVDFNSKAGPSLNIACQMCSAMAATQALKILLKRGDVKSVPHFCQFDPYLNKFKAGKLYFGNKNPIQQIKAAFVKKILSKKR